MIGEGYYTPDWESRAEALQERLDTYEDLLRAADRLADAAKVLLSLKDAGAFPTLDEINRKNLRKALNNYMSEDIANV